MTEKEAWIRRKNVYEENTNPGVRGLGGTRTEGGGGQQL